MILSPKMLSILLLIPTTLTLLSSLMFWSPSSVMFLSWSILHFPPLDLTLTVILDGPGTLFAGTVLLITTSILMFTTIYMQTEPFLPRFTGLLMLFVFSMLLLIFIPNMMTLLIGWDGLGLVSFLLVIYYQNSTALAGGMITAMTNRLGDVCLLVTIGWMTSQGHWLITHHTSSHTLLFFLVMLAAMTKSAQMPFSSWLPAAMAAPTPISALVHSSTLVTAGVFLLFRFYPSIMNIPYLCPSLLLASTLTMFMAGSVALVECDLKKIIALSTLSQLGVMMASLAFHMPTLTYFHLLTHALFKALLFMCAGALIHYSAHTQDLRKVGNLAATMPLTISALTTANLALTGAPFFSGFYSKDMILELSMFNPINALMILLFLLATLLTASYSIRLMTIVLWSPNMHSPMNAAHDEDLRFITPILTLTLFATTTGTILNWTTFTPLEHPCLPIPLKFAPLTLTILGTYLAWKLSTATTMNPSRLKSHFFLATMWFLTPLSTQMILKPLLKFSNYSLKNLDQGWLEKLGPQGLYNLNILQLKSLHPASNVSLTSHLLTGIILLPILLMC